MATPEEIKYWIGYAGHRGFNSEKEVRDFVFRRLQANDEQFAGVFAPSGQKKNQDLAKTLPVYKALSKFFIGYPQKSDPSPPLVDIDNIEFSSILNKGMKGMNINGNWITWPINSTGYPHHDDINAKYYGDRGNIGVQATNWFNGILTIYTPYGLFAEETQEPIEAFHGPRGSGSKLIIDSGDKNFEGTFQDYNTQRREYEMNSEENALAWVRKNCKFASQAGKGKPLFL